MAGDFNQVIDPILEKSPRGPLVTKDREGNHTLKEDMGLLEATNPPKKEYTFSPPSHSRIDFFLIANSLINSVTNCNIRTIAITNHAAVELCIDVESDVGRSRANPLEHH